MSSPVSVGLVSSARTPVSWRCMPSSRGRRGRRRTVPWVSGMRTAYHILICIPALRTLDCVHIKIQLEQQHHQYCRADIGVACSKLSLCMQTTLWCTAACSLRQYKRLAQLPLQCCARCAGVTVPSNTHMLCNGQGSIKLRVCIHPDRSCWSPWCQRVTIPIHPSILHIPVGPGKRYQLPSKPGGMTSGRSMSFFPGIALLRI